MKDILLKRFKKTGALMALLAFIIAGSLQAQVSIYTEDFEGVGPQLVFTDGVSSINGLTNWSYDQENLGILRFNYTAHNGSYSATFAAQNNGSEYTRNYLTLTIDLSEYDIKHDEIYLSFYTYNHGDEAHLTDRVWIRANAASTNREVQNITGAGGVWSYYNINISDVLRDAGENFSSTTQIIFGQEDNYIIPTDGRSFDDIEISGFLGSHTDYVVSSLVTPSSSSCGRATDSVTIAITNNTGVGINDVPVSVEVTMPGGSVVSLTGTYNDVIADGTTVLLNVGNINTTTAGNYAIKAITELPGVQNAFGYGYFSTQDFTIEPYYYENFSTGSAYEDFWKLRNATWDGGSSYIQTNPITPTDNASIISPKVQLNDTNTYMSFQAWFINDAAANQLDAEDSVLVQVSTNCGTSYTTIDTIFNTEYFGGWQTYGYNLDQTAFAGRNVNVRIMGGTTATSFTMYINSVSFVDDFDVAITGIYNLPESNFCNGYVADSILIDVQNTQVRALGEVDVEAQIRNLVTGELIQTINRTITLDDDLGGGIFGKTRAFVGLVNTLTPGTYGIYVSTLIADGDMSNNEDALIQSIGTATAIDLPAIATNFWDIGGWSTSGLTSQGDSAYFNLAANGSTGSITSPMVNATASTTLELALRATSDTIGGGPSANFMGAGDTVWVEVSNDCGINWTVVQEIDSLDYLTHQNFQTYSVNLASYAGQSIIARVLAKHEEPVNSIVTTFRPRIDLVKILEGNDHDASILEVYASEKECGEPTDTVYVVLRNSGTDALTNIPFAVDVELNGNTTTYEGTYAGTLAYEAFDTTFVIINTELLGTYYLAARTTVADDNYIPNDGDVYNSKAYTTAVTVPRYYLFDGGTPTGWSENGFSVGGGIYQTTVTDGDVTTLTTSRLAGVEANHYLFFDYFVANSSGTDDLSVEESLNVYISDDCDNGYTLVETIDESNHLPVGSSGEFRRVFIPLTAYAGDQIWVRLEAEKTGATTYANVSFVFDMLGISPYIDAHLLDLDLSTLSCGSNNDSVTVTVQNSGLENLTNVPVKLIMHFDNWDYEFDQTIAALAAGETVELVFDGLNTTNPGNYDFTAIVNVENDIVPGNDMAKDNASMLDTEPVPYLKTDDWFNGDWAMSTFGSWSFEWAYTTLYPGDEVTATSVSVGEIGPDSKLSVEYYIDAIGDFGTQSVLGVGDTIKTQISTDCGLTWTTVSTLHASNLKDFDGEWSDGTSGDNMYDTMSIGAFAGENIIVRIQVSKSDVPASSTDYFTYYLGYVSINNGNDVNINFIDLDDAYCASANDTVWVEVANNSIYEAIDVPVMLTVETPNGGMYMLYDTIPGIAPYEADSAIFVLNTVDSVGTFNLTAETMLEGDDSPGYATETRTIVATYFSPYLDDFETTDATWDAGDFNENTDAVYAEVYPGDELFTYSPKIVPVADIAQFEMTYQIIGFDNASARVTNSLEPGDTIKIYVSSDCGETWTVVDAISAADHNAAEEYQIYGVDLSAYEGTEIIIAVSVTNNQYNLDAAAYYRMEVDQFKVSNGIDVGATEIIRPSTLANCGLAAEPVSVEVTNFASLPQSNIPVTLEVYKSDEDMLMTKLTATIAGPLGPNESAIVDMGVVNTSAEGTYEFHAFTTQPGDTVFGSFMNDHTDDVLLVQDFINDPFTHNFNTTNPTTTGYVLEDMIWSGSYIYSPNLVSGDTSILVIPKFGAVEAGQYLSFSLFAESDGANWELSEEDSILVQISSDCGATYVTEMVIDSSNYKYDGNWQVFYVDLSAYEGMDINARIVGFKFPSMVVDNDHYSYDIDNVSWGIFDAGVSDVEIFTGNPYHTPKCGAVEVPVEVTVYNYGNLPISNIPVRVEFTFTNMDDYLLDFMIDTITLMNGESFTFIADTINTTMEGHYHVDAYTTYAMDNDMDNNDAEDDASTTYQTEVPYASCDAPDYFGGFWNTYISQFDTLKWEIPAKVGPIAANHMIGFSYYYISRDNSGNVIGNYMRTGDYIELLVSTDCGETYDVVYTIDMNNHHNMNYPVTLGESLAAYDGMTVWSKVRFVKGDVGMADVYFNCFYIDYADDAAIYNVEWLTNEDFRVCGSANDSVLVEVGNDGINELTSVPVKVIMSMYDDELGEYVKVDSVDVTYTGSIFNSEYDTVWAAGFNTDSAGTYMFEAVAMMPSDSNDANNYDDEYGTISVPLEISFIDHFTDISSTINTWYIDTYDNFQGDFNYSETGDGYVYLDNMRQGDTVEFKTPTVGTVDANTIFGLKYLVEAWELSDDYGLPTGNYLRPGDKIEIYASNDCFATETLLHTITSANHTDSADFQVLTLDLDAFAGGNIQVKIVVIKGEIGRMDIDVDYVAISNPDIGVIDLMLLSDYGDYEEDLCGLRSDSLYAYIYNYGLETVTDFNVAVDQNGSATSYPYSGEILPGDYDSLYVGIITIVNEDIIDFMIYTSLASDVDNDNDTMAFRMVNQPVAVPYRAFTEDWVMDDWKLEDMNRSGTELYTYWVDGYDMGDPIDSAWAISPVIEGVGEETFLVFDYELEIDDVTHFIFEEQMLIEVTTDCGETWTTVTPDVINNVALDVDIDDINNDADHGTVYADLSQFAGQEIIIKVTFMTGRSEDGFYMYMDDIKVIDLPIHRPEIHHTNTNIVCTGETYQFSTLGLPQAELYNWVIEPAEAAAVIGNGTVVNVTINEDFYGEFDITVQGVLDDQAIPNIEYEDDGQREMWGDFLNWYGGIIAYKYINGYKYYMDGTVRSAFSLPITMIADACLTDVDETTTDAFSVYPNPSKGHVSVDIPNVSGEVEIHVVSMKGAIVYSEKVFVDETVELDLTGLTDGIYYIELSSDEEVNRSILTIKK
ncbi:MAG: T9SS type A sorting domain-containing protein [Bacteroidales bacterium]|nr:T9SS type A sorting domain-containing protein [Bacteroidales bacterium]